MTAIRWTTEAADQLEAVVNRIREANPEAAHSVAQAILHRVAEFRLFRPRQTWGRKGTRELVSPPYVIVYRLHEDVAKILRVWHGAQDWC